MAPRTPRPSSRQSLGSCVVLPEPVSPATTTVWWSLIAASKSSRRADTGSSAVSAESLVACHPVAGEDCRGQGGVAGEHGRRTDLRELVGLALAVAPEQLQALALRRQPGPTAVGGHDQAGERDRPVVVAV